MQKVHRGRFANYVAEHELHKVQASRRFWRALSITVLLGNIACAAYVHKQATYDTQALEALLSSIESKPTCLMVSAN